MKKAILFFAMLLSCSVSFCPLNLWAQDGQDPNPPHYNFEPGLLNFLGRATINLRERELTLLVHLEKGVFVNVSGANQMVFELMGTITFTEAEGVYGHLGQLNGEGRTLFLLLNEDDSKSEFQGISCSINWDRCRFTDLVKLVYSKINQTWTITISGYINGRERINVKNQTLEIVPL